MSILPSTCYANSTRPLFASQDGISDIVSPLNILSIDRTKTLIISEQNTGASYIDNSANGGSVFVKPGIDHNLVIQGTIGTSSEAGLTITRSDLPGKSVDFEMDQTGSVVINSSNNIDLFPGATGSFNVIADAGVVVKPASTFASGNLTIQNILPTNPSSFNFSVPAIGTELQLIPSINGIPNANPSIKCEADGSDVTFMSNAVKVVGDLVSSGTGVSGLVVQASGATGNAGILIQNNNATTQGYQIVVGGATIDEIAEDHLQVFAYSGGANPKTIIDATPEGGNIVFGEADIAGGCSVRINGDEGAGRVYDTLYNKPCSFDDIWTSPQTLTAGSSLNPVGGITILPGTYQLQCEVNLQNNGSFSIPIGGSISGYLQLASAGYVEFSEIGIPASILIQPSSGNSNQPTFTSGTFQITTSNTYYVGLEVAGAWDFGTTGYIKYRLVKQA